MNFIGILITLHSNGVLHEAAAIAQAFAHRRGLR